MHCPRCGQQQVSQDVKFCSRCGFSLGLISEIVRHGGALPPQLADPRAACQPWLTRSTGLKISLVWFIAICFILVPLAAITRAPGGIIPGLAIIGSCGALLMSVLSFLFLKNENRGFRLTDQFSNPTSAPQFLGGNMNQTALPPQTSQPVSDYAPPGAAGSWKAPDTGELIPQSVTEGTTKLLQKDE